jgi:CRISPR-associated protein Csb2
MTTTLRLTLITGRYGATAWHRSEHEGQVEVPPSPWRLLRAILHGGFVLSGQREQLPDELPVIVSRLAEHPPSYHLPFGEYGQIRGFRPTYGAETIPPLIGAGMVHSTGKRRQFVDAFLQFPPGSAIHVSWPVVLNPEQERLLGQCLACLTYLGRAEYPAIWQVVPHSPPTNCLPDPAGSLSVLGASACPELIPSLLTNPQEARQQGRQSLPGQHWLAYSYKPERPAALRPPLPTLANRALYAFLPDHPIRTEDGIRWTDRLHRALLQKAPASPRFAGCLAGQPLPEQYTAWYQWQALDGLISTLEVFSFEPFQQAELEALKSVRRLYGRGGSSAEIRLMALQHTPPVAATRWQTRTPMWLYTSPRDGKLQRTPAAQAIQTLLWGLGEAGKVEPGAFRDDQQGVVLEHSSHGLLRAVVTEMLPVQTPPSRGERKPASGLSFHLQLESERPLPARGIGWGRHFGAGELEPLV